MGLLRGILGVKTIAHMEIDAGFTRGCVGFSWLIFPNI